MMIYALSLCVAVPVSAHSMFKKNFSAKYPGKKVSCNACHSTKAEIEAMDKVDPNDKKPRNNYGKLIQSQFDSKTLTADYKSKSGDEKKKFETDVMIPEFEKAFAKVKAMTVHDLIEAGFFNGIDTPKK